LFLVVVAIKPAMPNKQIDKMTRATKTSINAKPLDVIEFIASAP
jgi:hypothetical protein